MMGIVLAFISMSLFLNMILSKEVGEIVYSATGFLIFITSFLFLFLPGSEVGKIYPLLICIVLTKSAFLMLKKKSKGSN